MTESKLLLRRSSVDIPYGFIIRHISFYPSKGSSIEGMKCPQKPFYVLIILSVKPASVADKAGLRTGHQIIGMNGHGVNRLNYSDVCRITERMDEL
uniref:PDZ domain-containing protein n=1 Tax=Loa loa TaxID=7209 RepID=A0A1I7VZL2_LOALO